VVDVERFCGVVDVVRDRAGVVATVVMCLGDAVGAASRVARCVVDDVNTALAAECGDADVECFRSVNIADVTFLGLRSSVLVVAPVLVVTPGLLVVALLPVLPVLVVALIVVVRVVLVAAAVVVAAAVEVVVAVAVEVVVAVWVAVVVAVVAAVVDVTVAVALVVRVAVVLVVCVVVVRPSGSSRSRELGMFMSREKAVVLVGKGTAKGSGVEVVGAWDRVELVDTFSHAPNACVVVVVSLGSLPS